MCVIMAVEETRATPEMVRAAFKSNNQGGGVAWRDEVEDPKDKTKRISVVKWKKAITDPEEMVHFAETLPLPHILHFRIQSVGGPSLDLTHPFPVSRDASVAHEGQTPGQVLFHNGTWHQWDSEGIKSALLRGVKLPRGPWSDTRMMAWVTHLISPGFLDIIKEKVILFGPGKGIEDIEIFGTDRGNGWQCIEGVWCSNGGFQHNMRQERQQKSTILTPNEQVKRIVESHAGRGGDRHPVGFLDGSTHVEHSGRSEAGEDQQEGAETVSGGLRKRSSEAAQKARQGGARRPLIEDEEFIELYKDKHGHPPPFRMKDWASAQNPKKFRASAGRTPVM